MRFEWANGQTKLLVQDASDLKHELIFFYPIFTKITELCFPKIFNNLPMFRLCLDEIMFIIYLTSGH